jgi:tetratricopeptide (TPR) repeat protein
MRFRYTIVVFLCTGLCAFAQQQPNPNTPSTQPDKDCNWQAKKGSSGPWNATSSCPPSSRNPANGSTPALVPDKKSAGQEKPSPAAANPFPEAKSRKAADATNRPANAPSGTSSSHVDLNRLNAPAGSEARISNGEGGYIHSPELAKKDEKVGKFYLQNKDYKGAYDRFKEATLVAPEDGNAVFGLAESARGLQKTQEAITNYSIYLQAFPDGKKAKDAEKALAELKSPKKK